LLLKFKNCEKIAKERFWERFETVKFDQSRQENACLEFFFAAFGLEDQFFKTSLVKTARIQVQKLYVLCGTSEKKKSTSDISAKQGVLRRETDKAEKADSEEISVLHFLVNASLEVYRTAMERTGFPAAAKNAESFRQGDKLQAYDDRGYECLASSGLQVGSY
jgi:hypothetical protein